MAHYWTDHHATSFLPADGAIHAGITRLYLQDNLSCVYEQSGYDLATYAVAGVTANSTDHWTNIDSLFVGNTLLNAPVPIYEKAGSGYRTYLVGVDAYATAHFHVMVYLSPRKYVSASLDPDSGIISGVSSYVELPFTGAGSWEYVEGTITVPDAGVALVDVPGSGCAPMTYLWPKLAIKAESGLTILINGLRIRENA